MKMSEIINLFSNADTEQLTLNWVSFAFAPSVQMITIPLQEAYQSEFRKKEGPLRPGPQVHRLEGVVQLSHPHYEEQVRELPGRRTDGGHFQAVQLEGGAGRACGGQLYRQPLEGAEVKG